jgi:hypothetical protein
VQPGPAAAGPGHLAGQVQVPGAPVGDTGQGVVVGQGFQLGRLVLDLVHELGHAGHDQQEQHDRAGPERHPVDRQPACSLVEQQHRGDQGGRRQQQQAPAADPDAAGRGHLRQQADRRVQGGRAPAQVRGHPAEVDHAAAVAPVGGEPGVDDVGAKLQHQGQAEQPVARAAGTRAGGQPGQHGQQKHVGQRVGERDQSRPQPHGGVGRDRPHQERPRKQPQAGGDDQGVDQPGPVPAAGPAADHDQQGGRQERVAGQVECVGRGGERLAVQHVDVHAVDHVAGHEHPEPRGQAVPDATTRRPVQAHPDEDRDDRRQAHQLVDERVLQVGQPQAADRDRQPDGQVQQPESPAYPSGCHPSVDRRFRRGP